MPRPDVALVSPYPPLGLRHAGRSGVASYTANLAEALADAGARVAVVADRLEGERERSRDGAVHVLRRWDRGPRAMVQAARAALATRAATVHVQHETFLFGGPPALPGLVAGLAALRAAGHPAVVTMHQVVDARAIDRDFTQLHRVPVPPFAAAAALGGVQSAVRRLAREVIVHEPSFARLAGGATVIPHGIELARPLERADARRELGLDDDATYVLCFGFLAPYKGLETALEAGERADGRFTVVVAGDEHPRLAGRDPYAARLRERHGHHARFTGHVPEPDVARWFSAADAALFAYPRPFSSSGAFALALAYRTPPLLSRPMADSMDAPEPLVVPTDPEALARELDGLAADGARRAEVAAIAQRLAADRSWPAVARRHLEVYGSAS